MHPAHVESPGRRPAALLAVIGVVLALLVAQAPPAWASDPGRAQQWPLDVIGADAGHAVGQGRGVVIAIVDSGVDLGHEDLADRLVAGRDLVEDDDEPQDEHGHGTHVAGIAAAIGGNGRGVVGTAPAARIMPVRVLDGDGRGSSRDVDAGIRWAVDNGADVVNLSLGEAAQGLLGSSLTAAVRYAWEQGVIVVVAAGNDFVLSSGFSDEPAVVVSATTRDDAKPDYSNGVGSAQWGMAAPGGGCAGLLAGCPREEGVLSTYWVRGKADSYGYLRGTSMAAPHVAGAAAVLRSLGLGPRATVDRLLATAHDIGPAGRDSTFGAGRLDLAAAAAGRGSAATGGEAGVQQTPSAAAPAAPDATDSQSAGDTATAPREGPGAGAPRSGQAPPATAPAAPSSPPPASPRPSPAPAAPSPTPPPPVAASGPGEPATAADAPDTALQVLALVLLLAAAGAVWTARGKR